jgi:hypothetical protein
MENEMIRSIVKLESKLVSLIEPAFNAAKEAEYNFYQNRTFGNLYRLINATNWCLNLTDVLQVNEFLPRYKNDEQYIKSVRLGTLDIIEKYRFIIGQIEECKV